MYRYFFFSPQKISIPPFFNLVNISDNQGTNVKFITFDNDPAGVDETNELGVK
jgi:hypothetical protein